MPYPFCLPTTSATALTSFFTSQSHPSLVAAATSQRALVRDVLKRHKRLAPTEQTSNLVAVQDALNHYLPYLLSIYTGAPDVSIATSYGGNVQVAISEVQELLTEWRSTLSSTLPGREPPRAKVVGLRNELAFVLESLAYTFWHLARASLWQLARFTSPSSEQRSGFVATTMKHLLEAQSIHSYVATLNEDTSSRAPLDVSASTATALASLALAEATLTVVLKDDPYAAAVTEDRNKDSKEWMIAAPSIPKVRAHLFARISIAAADHAAKASSLLPKATGTNEDIIKYADDLRRTAKGKAARFLGIDAEASGKTGEAIAWLRGAKRELGVLTNEESSGRKGFRGLKQTWSERREDRRVEGGTDDWGLDAGRFEEIRVVEWLEAKWVKMNNTINVQSVPSFEPLLAALPSGREYHTPRPYMPPDLESGTLERMKAPINPAEQISIGDDDDSDKERPSGNLPGAFPGPDSGGVSGRASYY